MAYILDADWAIHALGGHPKTLQTLDYLLEEVVSISLVTVGEVYEKAFNSSNPQAHLDSFRVFFRPYRLLNLSDSIVERFAEIRSYLRRRGAIIGNFDIILGATALEYDLTILTYNVRHLQRIPDIKVYQSG